MRTHFFLCILWLAYIYPVSQDVPTTMHDPWELWPLPGSWLDALIRSSDTICRVWIITMLSDVKAYIIQMRPRSCANRRGLVGPSDWLNVLNDVTLLRA